MQFSKGAFRSDLFYRLNVFPIEMPPCASAWRTIALLTEYFIQRYAQKLGKKISGISKRTLDQFRSYSWPGNIRELQNVIERTLILCETESFSVDENWLTRESSESEMANHSLGQRLATDEKALIEAALAEARGEVPASSALRPSWDCPPPLWNPKSARSKSINTLSGPLENW
jgi:transcriptional regulator with PAS, ATPase and Fis domain